MTDKELIQMERAVVNRETLRGLCNELHRQYCKKPNYFRRWKIWRIKRKIKHIMKHDHVMQMLEVLYLFDLEEEPFTRINWCDPEQVNNLSL